jgi:hypothetical protein
VEWRWDSLLQINIFSVDVYMGCLWLRNRGLESRVIASVGRTHSIRLGLLDRGKK